jgi:hypothetical protein
LQNRPGRRHPNQKRIQNEKPQNSGKSLHSATTPVVASRQCFRQGVFTRPR